MAQEKHFLEWIESITSQTSLRVSDLKINPGCKVPKQIIHEASQLLRATSLRIWQFNASAGIKMALWYDTAGF